MQATMTFWDRVAEKYAKSPISDMAAYEYTLERTRSHMADTDRVLELGCGTGSTALALSGSAAEIVASDISPKMLEVGRRKAAEQGVETVRFVRAEASGVVEGAPYDMVMAFNLLHLLEAPQEAIAGVAERLKPGGLFVSKTICLPERGLSLKLNVMRLILPVMQVLGRAPYVRIGKIVELERMITDAGFDIVETGNHPAHPPRRYIVARKRG